MVSIVLIPNYHCNFKCDFCFGNNNGEPKLLESLHEDRIFSFIKNVLKYERSINIIMNGGEPLLLPVSFYEKLISIVNGHGRISIQSNGYELLKNLDKWIHILQNPIVDIGLSFQYGNHRKLKDGTIFSETLFLELQNKLKERLGYNLFFLSVLTDDNKDFDSIDKFINLGKTLRVQSRLSYISKHGDGDKFYIPQHEVIDIYKYILKKDIKAALNIEPLRSLILGKTIHDKCPYTRECYYNVFTVDPSGLVFNCGSADYKIDRKIGSIDNDWIELKTKAMNYKCGLRLSDECDSCEHAALCLGCSVRTLDVLEESKEQQERYCMNFKSFVAIINKIRRIGR